MIKITLQRLKEYKSVKAKGKDEPSIIGYLQVENNGVILFEGYTCENGGTPTDESGKDKPIIARKYQLEWTKTQRNSSDKLGKWKNKALWLKCKEKPEFANRRILIHIGNYPQDTLGCILVGSWQGNNGTISDSVKAITRLFNLLEPFNLENIDFEIKDIKEP